MTLAAFGIEALQQCMKNTKETAISLHECTGLYIQPDSCKLIAVSFAIFSIVAFSRL